MMPSVNEQLRIAEKRREERRVANGAVLVRFTDPGTQSVEGRLMDVSAGGFRMSHACRSLTSGQLVDFEHVEAVGKAQVIWTRILEGTVETGFRVVKP
jgi:hypothetical protein